MELLAEETLKGVRRRIPPYVYSHAACPALQESVYARIPPYVFPANCLTDCTRGISLRRGWEKLLHRINLDKSKLHKMTEK
jgi:hypothetical protein